MTLMDMGSGYNNPPGPGQGTQRNISEAVDSFAQRVELHSKHDQFATAHSILGAAPDLEMDRRAPYSLATKVLLAVLNIIFFLIGKVYKVVMRNEKLVRREMGPRWLNKLLGILIHPYVEIVREGVTTSAALDALYAANRFFPGHLDALRHSPWWYRIPRTLGARLCWWVANLSGPEAVRNRLRLVFVQFHGELKRLVEEGVEELQLLSLACGSAEATIYAVWHLLREYPDVKVKLTLVDLSRDSLDRARRLAQALSVDDHVEIVRSSAEKFWNDERHGRFHVVEMVGFLDYRDEKWVRTSSESVRALLHPGGLYVSAHIAPEVDAATTRWLIGWPLLVRRTEAEFCRLLTEGGWNGNEITTLSDPRHVHTVALCRKSA